MELSEESFNKMVKARARKHTNESFRYFWASFALQILVYSLLSHVIVKYWGNLLITLPGLTGIILFIPFTIVLMKKFKSMAILKDTSIHTYVQQQYQLLESFYKFKRRYELVLIPLATLIGTYITFQIYVPGLHTKGVMITFLIALASCVIAIREENKKSFDIPLSKLKGVLKDLEE